MAKVKKILVIKHGALGDIIQGLDSFNSLRCGHPDAQITLLTAPAFAGLGRMMPWFDEVIVDPRASIFNLAASLTIRRIFRQRWDIVLDQQCSKRTAHYHRFFCPNTVRWFGTAPGASDPYPDFTGVNNRDRMLTAAMMAGGDQINMADTPMDWLDKEVSPLVTMLPDRPVILVPGCSPAKPQKRWSPHHVADLARRLKDAGHAVIIVGTAAERSLVDEVMAAAPFCVDIVGQTDLPSLAAVFRRAALVVGNDTGPVFLAARSGVATIMIMGPDTDPQMSAPTGAHCAWVRKTPIDDVTPDDVLGAARDHAML